jgi:extracellular elastinolytic metalloproteinase
LNAAKCLMGVGVLVPCLLGGPAFGAAPSGRTAIDVAFQYVERNQQRLGLNVSDIDEMVVSSEVFSEHNGVTHVYLQQRYRGIDVHNGILNVNVLYGSEVLGAGNRFATRIAAAAGAQSARLSPLEAVRAAAQALELGGKQPFAVLDTLGGASRSTLISDGGVASRPIEANLVWYPVAGAVRLAWKLEIEESARSHWWLAFVDATTGALLGKEDLTVEDSLSGIRKSIARPAAPTSSVRARGAQSAPLADGASYNVFPIPFESPNDGDRQLVTNPADLTASPFGWHDINGADGAEYTVTRGNNVHAYVDADLPNNVPDPGSDPDGGPALVFDFPLDLTQDPATYRPAVVANLFYWNNIVHDVTYGYGFNEAAGNFQVNNYGRGGIGNDDVRAEAQDRSGTDNANFSTSSDGNRPRMQMYRWLSPFAQLATVNSPGAIAGVYVANPSVNGGTANGLTADLVIVDDGVPPADDACEPVLNDLTGKIALIRWSGGLCNSSVFVNNAVIAGAVAAIIIDRTALPYTNFGGSTLIPSVAVGIDDGNLFVSTIVGGDTVNVTIDDNPDAVDRDSDLDAGVIAHEYGHGISNRLTGGPATASCLGNAEQMGEGWSDWFGMTMTAKAGDTGLTPRGVGTYVIFQDDPGSIGIRNTQYTTDMGVNPSTYAWVADTLNVSQPHGIGYVWNTMLWEMYWNLIDRHGFNPDIYGGYGTGGNNLAFQLVMDGLKLQVCRPGFVDGRDAILLGDVALTGGANQCEIWRGFAKRGLGASASQGSSLSRTDGIEAFDLPAACTAAVFGGFASPVSNPPAINQANAGSTIPIKFQLSGVAGVPPIDTQEVDCTTLQPTGSLPEEPAMPGNSGIKHKGDQYQFNWKTSASWEGTCRKLTVRIPAAADGVAYFSFF